ncbi:MAG: hypothetical protein IT310_02590 [Anaerolineales bacterium]|nr:hypothetical protein [Anaerolineales bacterium]
MIAPVHHVIGLTSIVRERILPIAGNILVRQGQKVNATDVIAEAKRPYEHVLLDVARLLRISPASAEKLIRCKVGERLAAGTEIAKGKGLLASPIKVPRDGTVAAVGGGQVLLEVGVAKVEVKAGVPGTVIEVLPGRGAVIQTAGSLVQGVWGNDKIEVGVLVNLMSAPDDILTEAKMDVSLRGSILLGGMVNDKDVLRAAAELPARGLIIPSLAAALLPLAREMKYPIVVTDGIGAFPMNSAAYRLLSTNAKREIVINAEAYDRYTGAKPEVIIPLPISSEPPPAPDAQTLAAGLQVRLLRPPAMGALGFIEKILPGLTTLPSGLSAPAAEVKLENDEMIIAPLVNLEVVG